MLFYPQHVKEALKKLEAEVEPGASGDFEKFALEVLKLDPENGYARHALALAAANAGDLDRAEELSWEALERRPDDFDSYFTLSSIVFQRDKESLSNKLAHLGTWKAALSEEVDEATADVSLGLFADGEDPYDPRSYRAVAEAMEEEMRMAPLERRLVPFYLLNDLEREAPYAVEYHTRKRITQAGSRCAPVFIGALRQLARSRRPLNAPVPLLLIAFLGEIGGPELIGDLLEIAGAENEAVFKHVNWALWRIGQRHGKEALRILREAIPGADAVLRLVLAEQFHLMRSIEGVAEALTSLLDDFGAQARKDEGAAFLLAAVASALIEREKDEEARSLIARYTPLLNDKGRQWIEDVFEGDDEFRFALERYGIAEYGIQDVCEERVFMVTGVESQAPPTPTMGRDDACWCGSGRKYAKCHMNRDGAEFAMPHVEEHKDDRLIRKLCGEILEGEALWHTDADEERAKWEFFGEAGMEKADGMELDAYVQWYMHSFRDAATGRTLVEHFWEGEPRKLGLREKQIAKALLDSYIGLFAVEYVHSGESVEVRNCASGAVLFVNDEHAAMSLEPGDWVLTRVLELDGELRFLSCGLVIPRRLQKECGQFIEDKARAQDETPDQLVRRCGLQLYREICKLRKSRKKAVKR